MREVQLDQETKWCFLEPQIIVQWMRSGGQT